MSEGDESKYILKSFTNTHNEASTYSKLSNFIKLTAYIGIIFYGISYVAKIDNTSPASMAISIFATGAAIQAIIISSAYKKSDYIEKCLYNFYYPLEDHLTDYLIKGEKLNKEDTNQVYHYRYLARKETRIKFEICRDGNYQKNDVMTLSTYIKIDIAYYHKELKKL